MSRARCPSDQAGLGHRLQALLSDSPGAASDSYLRAWATGDAPPELAVEIVHHFMTERLSTELKAFVDALPPAVRDNERIILARAVVAADDRDFDELERLLLGRPFATIREGETLLSDLWVACDEDGSRHGSTATQRPMKSGPTSRRIPYRGPSTCACTKSKPRPAA